jgi:hypothetical protein
MHCLMLLSSLRWLCALSGSVRGRISELMLSKGGRIAFRLRFTGRESKTASSHLLNRCDLCRLTLVRKHDAADGHANYKHHGKHHSNYTIISWRTKSSHLLVQEFLIVSVHF